MFAIDHTSSSEARLWIGGLPKQHLQTKFPEYFRGASSQRDYEKQFTWIMMKKRAEKWTTTLNEVTIGGRK